MAKAKKSVVTLAQYLKNPLVSPMSPRSLWSRRMRRERLNYRRHFVRNDACWNGGYEDRDYEKSRDCEKLSTKQYNQLFRWKELRKADELIKEANA
jgi:hypothetical protein